MSSPIDAIGASSYATATAASASQTASQSRAEQLAALNQLLYKYQVGISRGESAGALAALTRQITAAEKSLGQHLSLPKAPPRSTDRAASGGRASANAATKHGLNATA